MEYVVQVPHTFRSERGFPVDKMPGDLVNVDNRKIAQKLIAQGKIAEEKLAATIKTTAKALPLRRVFRVGCFIHTSTFYSGGRIHLYQVAWTLANMGAEVFLITDNNPKWMKDYPEAKNLFLINRKDSHNYAAPQDLDVIFTDGKGWAAIQAKRWKKEHPFIPLVCLNFETPNWVQKYAPECAPRMPEMKDAYEKADCMLCNSGESLKWLREFMKVPRSIGVLPPAANTFTMDKQVELPFDESLFETPYVVWSARASAYKGAAAVSQAILDLDFPMNLVMIGKPNRIPQDTAHHQFIKFQQPLNDAQKMKLMAGAVCIAAPSRFEGYGMVPGEALCNGTPAVVYDLPVLRENYGDRLIYARWNDLADFTKKLKATVKNPPVVDAEEARRTYGMGAMKKHIEKLPYLSFNRKRVSAQMICYYGATVQEAIASVYNHADEVIVAYGPTALWRHIPEDGTLKLIEDFPDPENKIRILRAPREEGFWLNKGEMRKACQAVMTGNYLLIVDADEIYHGLDKWIESDINFGCPRWVHFWHDQEHFVSDLAGMQRWGKPHELGGSTHNHFRWAYWRYSNEWSNSRGTVAKDCAGARLTSALKMQEAVAKVPETCIYHLGHVLSPELMSAKHEFYLKRDGADAGRKKRATAWRNWNGKVGDCGDGNIQKVFWDLPPLVLEAFEKTNAVKGASL